MWVAYTELVLLACIALTWRVARNPNQRARLTAMWLCYTPYYLELYMGQFSFVQGALLFLMLVLATVDRLGWGFDLAWIGSVLWKQNTALLLPLMVRLERWRVLLLLALLLVLTSAPYFALVPGSLLAFVRNFAGEPPWFQLGNLGFRQLVFDAMWSLGELGVGAKEAIPALQALAADTSHFPSGELTIGELAELSIARIEMAVEEAEAPAADGETEGEAAEARPTLSADERKAKREAALARKKARESGEAEAEAEAKPKLTAEERKARREAALARKKAREAGEGGEG